MFSTRHAPWACLAWLLLAGSALAAEGASPDSCLVAATEGAPDVEQRCSEVAEHDSQNSTALLSLAQSLDREGHSLLAVSVLEVANRRFPGRRALLQAQLSARAHARDRARLLPSPEVVDPRLEACWQGRWRDALAACLSLAEAQQHREAPLLARLAALHRSVGQPKLALRAYESALAVDPARADWRRAAQVLRGMVAAAPQAADLVAKPAETGRAIAPVQEALVIGNARYAAYPELHSAVNDARSVAALLRQKYGMRVVTLYNATRNQLMDALAAARTRLREGDDLLVYYAGHGHVDSVTGQGYWLPVNAQPQSPANWVSTNDVRTALMAVAAQDVLLIADSCYAGTLLSDYKATAAEQLRSSGQSRMVLASGNLEPVLDDGRNGHSVFANALLNELRLANSSMNARSLFDGVSARLRGVVQQRPVFGSMQAAGGKSEFVFKQHRG